MRDVAMIHPEKNKRGEWKMKKMLSASAAVLALLVLAGCCCDKAEKCHKNHHHTAQCGENCDSEKKDCGTMDTKTASNDNGHNGDKEDDSVKETKLSSR